MNLSTRVLGTHAVHHLEELTEEAVLIVGKDRLTRHDLAAVGCYNFPAARRLSAAVAKQLSVRSLKQLFDEIAPTDLALPGLGVISLAVLGAAWEHRGIGGEAPLESYVKNHRAQDEKRELLTFDSIKRREHDRLAVATKTKRRRRA
jgi:hypothetical protein